MKRNFLLLAFLCALLVGFGPDVVQAQSGIVSIDHVTGMTNGKLSTSQPIRFIMRFNNNLTAKVDVSNGWRLTSPDGAAWDSLTIDSIGAINNMGTPDDPSDDINVQFNNRFDIVFSLNAFQGEGADTVGVLGVGSPTKATKQLTAGYNDTALAIIMWQTNNTASGGKHVCLDSAFWGIGGTWKWVGKLGPFGELVDVFPEWKGIGAQAHVDGQGYCFQFEGGVVTKTLQVTPTTLTFNAVEGVAPPTQTINITEAAAQPLNWTATGMGTWLTVTPSSGATPATPVVGINMSGLTAGTYKDTIVVTGADATNGPLNVIVTLNVTAALQTMTVTPDTLSFTMEQGGALPTFQNFAVSATGTITYAATEATDWFSLQNANGTTPANVRVDILANTLAPGTYVGAVTFTSAGASNSPITRQVKLVVTQSPRMLAVEPVDLNFTAIEGGPAPTPQPVTVTETHGDSLTFTATGFASWINLTATDFKTPGGFTVNINMTGVTEGTYKDTIVVTAGTAANSPLNVVVTLTVGAPASKLLALTPDTLHFNAIVGGSNPVDQWFRVNEAGGGNITFTASETTDWLTLTDETGTTPDSVLVSVNIATLAAGTYTAAITVASGDADNSPVTEYVVLHLTSESCPDLALSDSVFTTTVQAGTPVDVTDTLTISSSGPGEIEWAAVNLPQGLTVNTATGTTPSTVYVTLSKTYNEAGAYDECFTLQGHKPGDTTACLVSKQVCVHVTVTPVGCAQLVVNDTTFTFTAEEGPAQILSGDLIVSRSDMGASAFTVSRPLDADWLMFVNPGGDTANTATGTTTDTIKVIVNTAALAAGTYQAVGVITTTDEGVCSPRARYFVVALTVTGAPVVSADSIFIGKVAAQPGGTVAVPIDFTNQCPLMAGALFLDWGTNYLTLDSISYIGSRINTGATLSDSVTVDNGSDIGSAALRFEANNAGQMIPAGSGLWANLYFSVDQSTPLGTQVLINVGPDGATFTKNCGDSIQVEDVPVMGGRVMVDTLSESICGYVTDEEGVQIVGATVQLWANFPYGSPVATTTTNENGAFFFYGPTPMPYDVYAFAEGYYPGLHEDMTSNQCGTIKLVKLEDFVPPTTDRNMWVDYYCGHNTFNDSVPLPVGSVIEVRDPQGTLAGRQVITSPGLYPFMPVYRDSADTPEDEGATTGDMLLFFINGTPAQTSPALVTYPADYEEVEVCVNGSTTPQACQLHEGWNLVSWRVDTPSDDIQNVLGPIMDCIEVVLGYEGGGLTYDPDLQEFSTLLSVDHLSGYWIKVKAGCSPSLTLNGVAVPANTPIPVYRGWNLVSYLADVPLTPEVALTSVADKLIIAYGFDMGVKVYKPAQSNFNTLDAMEPCLGYWMKLTGDDELIYPTEGLAPMARGNENPGALAARRAAPSDVANTIAWVNVYSRGLTLDGQPVKAGAEIAAYTEAGVKIGSYRLTQDGKFGFMPVYSDAGLSEEVTGLKVGEKFTLKVDGVETAQSFAWTTSGDRIEISRLTAKGAGTLPGTFSLAQNYPNPFNPSTKISFSLPAKGQARLEVYNILGRLVAVPFDGIAEAGDHEVIWDGRNSNGASVASGVYFYRLTADKYTDTKKMMLLK